MKRTKKILVERTKILKRKLKCEMQNLTEVNVFKCSLMVIQTPLTFSKMIAEIHT